MSWQDHHRREVVLDRILAEPSTARTGRIPAGYRTDIEAFFGDEDGLLLALYARWFDDVSPAHVRHRGKPGIRAFGSERTAAVSLSLAYVTSAATSTSVA